MTHTPQRPFVLQRTPSEPGDTGAGKFNLPRPFVHGEQDSVATRTRATAAQPAASAPTVRTAPPPLPLVYDPPADTPPRAADALQSIDAFATKVAPVEPEPLAPIEQYLETVPSYSRDASVSEDGAYELPPVEHFMDTVPEGPGIASGGHGETMTHAPAREDIEAGSDAPEWGDTDWQHYDWRGAAALGEGADPEASNAWSETNWDNASAPAKEVRATAAKAIADALDGIARRIREGELVIPSPESVADPAAIAATLAALLGVKR